MNKRTLGKTGLQVSEVGFGCWAIGGTSYGPTDDQESLLALETAWYNGVNFYDTADTYGHGHSETLLAQFLKNKPREKVIVASKAGWDFYHGASKKNFDPDYIRFACDESLKRLQTDYMDLYQLHNPKPEIIRNGIIDVLTELKKAGKIRFIGISIHTEEDAKAAMENPAVDCLQLVFNLLEQKMADNVFALAKKNKIGIIAREPLACGLLTGKYTPKHEFDKEDHRRRWTAEKLDLELKKVNRIQEILATRRLPISQAALEYVLEFEEVSTVIPGAKTKTQVLQNLKASLDPQLRSQESNILRGITSTEPLFRQTATRAV